jgi:predicted AAA+ superfamily ATPase
VILLAKRCERRVFINKGHTPAQKLGLRYENKVVKQLIKEFGPAMVEHNPWYNYQDETGFHACCPDILIHKPNLIFIIEVKYTMTPEAVRKLYEVYRPVIYLATNIKTRPIIIIKNALRGFTYDGALVIQWLGMGPIEIPGLEN